MRKPVTVSLTAEELDMVEFAMQQTGYRGRRSLFVRELVLKGAASRLARVQPVQPRSYVVPPGGSLVVTDAGAVVVAPPGGEEN